jgi:hypothetical protein
VNEARFGYTRFFNSIGTYLAFNTNVVDSLGIPNFSGGQPVTWGIPNITIINYSSIGDSTEGPYANSNNSLQLVDNLSWTHGKHAFRFGFEYMRQNYNQVGNQFARGQFTFQPNGTQGSNLTGGDSFADFLLGDMYQSEAAVQIATANFQRNTMAAWVDDTWKISPKLTLSLGLRYEYTPPFYDTLGNLFTVYQPTIDFEPQAPADHYPVFMRQGNCTDPYAGIRIRWPQITAVCSNGTEAPQLAQTHYKNFAPRVGIAWMPGTKWVVRLGAGDFYNQDIGNGSYFDMARQIAGRFRVNSSLGTPTLFWSNALAAGNGATAQITSPFAFEAKYSHNTSYSWEYLANVQRQLSGNWVLELGYLGSISHHLFGFRDANESIPGLTPLATRTPYSTFGIIQMVNDAGNANYNAASVKLTKRFGAGVSMVTSYTYSKSIDNTSGIRVQGYDTLYPQNSDCGQCERGLSSFDTRNRLITSVLYDIPVGKGRAVALNSPFLNAIAGGWQVGGIWTVQSGLPEVITLGGFDRSNTGVGYDRPIATGASQYAATLTPSRWFNPDAFVEAPAGSWGNVGRDTAITPAIFATDFEAHKQFYMPHSDHHMLQFRFEAFNVFNHPVWGNPNGSILAGAAFPGAPATAPHQGFGAITSTQIAMRQLQLALKFVF